jgi:hypothetical protein
MRKTDLVSILAAAALACACEQPVESVPPSAATAEEASEASYSPIPIDAADEPGTPRQVRCQIGSETEQTCTLTPLFGDDSFQLDGAGVALRMVVTGNEGGLFEVMGAEQRVPIAGVYRRSSPSDPCWVAEEGAAGPSPICIR